MEGTRGLILDEGKEKLGPAFRPPEPGLADVGATRAARVLHYVRAPCVSEALGNLRGGRGATVGKPCVQMCVCVCVCVSGLLPRGPV